MSRSNIITALTKIFIKEFDNESIVLKDDLTANDIDNWDSLSHMLMISSIEDEFSIRFKLKELNKMKNVGNLIDFIESKLTNRL